MWVRKHGIDHSLREVQRELRRARRAMDKGAAKTARKLHQIILSKADVA